MNRLLEKNHLRWMYRMKAVMEERLISLRIWPVFGWCRKAEGNGSGKAMNIASENWRHRQKKWNYSRTLWMPMQKNLYHLAICRAGFVNIVNRRVRQYRRRRARSYAASIRVLQWNTEGNWIRYSIAWIRSMTRSIWSVEESRVNCSARWRLMQPAAA